MGCCESTPNTISNPMSQTNQVMKTKTTDLSNVDTSNWTDEEIAKFEMGFFQKLKSVDTNRNYTIIVDRSGSMAGSNWNEAREAVEYLVPFALKRDSDGICLYFFDSQYVKLENITESKKVHEAFKKYPPNSSTNLALVLEDAVKPDDASGRPETILVITDGTPDNKSAVERVIIAATKKMKSDEDLSITIIQVGHDSGADKWLIELDDGLVAKGAKFDIVDVMSVSSMKGMSFNDVIAKSISD
jgi:hypothetical protein